MKKFVKSLVTASVFIFFFLGVTHMAWAPAEERKIPSSDMLGPLYLKDGSSTVPSLGFTSEKGTGLFLTKAGTMALAIEGTGEIIVIDSTAFTSTIPVIVPDAVAATESMNRQTCDIRYPQLAAANTFTKANIFNGNVTLGAVVGDTVTQNAGIHHYPNATTIFFDGAATYFFDGATLFNLDAATIFDATGFSPEMRGITWDFATNSTNVTVPDADAATEAANLQTGDGRWSQLSAANTFANTNIIRFAGLPLTLEDTTNADDVNFLKLYGARGAGNGIDGATGSVLFQFDDDTGTSIPVQIIAVMDDADPKGGTFGSFLFQSGSTAPATICKVDGITNTVQGDFFSFLDDVDTGMFGGVGLLQAKTSNITRWEIVESGSYARVVGFGQIIDGQLAVNTTIGAMDGSVLAEFASTTQGTLPAPRQTTAQRTAMSSVVAGVQVDDSDLNALARFNGTAWEIVAVDVPTIKSGTVAGTSFAGNPKVFTVTFATAFPDANYAITIAGEDNRTWTYGTKLAASFIINSNANLAFTGNVDWTATAYLDP